MGPERAVYLIPQEAIRDDEFDLVELWRVIWQGRWLMFAITAVAVGIAAGYAVLATPWYRAESLLIAAEEQAAPGLFPEFGGLAGLAGIKVGTSNSAEPIAVLTSQGFAREFIEGRGLVTVLLADEWDEKNKRWMETDPTRQPDWRDAVEAFDEDVLSVSEDSSTGVITLAIEWTDPAVAAEWANALVTRLNDRMRQTALANAKLNVEYLQSELTSTSVVAVQQAVGRLLESEMQKLMMARGKSEYALRVIDRAEAPKDPTRPQRLLVIALSAIAAAMLSALFVMLRHAVRARHDRSQ